ncbi:RepB family plasmid replication initiator protein (plasmid) [Candidatus Williamhamiltonella defendens]|uniref:RepB family plasmid replication initiator protein n=1 Tax=Candidatus Williamhamiltonella defendens TaxID=138072 RepID=A0AAC9VKE8_9ENTR|nr:replication initiator protein A [Candidatus Hamiltonella defensa]ASV34598.1 RepB family plasmid replication initiator protein [Candidatus Hamiltonella defensa]AWK17559.1 RepB family plasmid replication initiator protein [Candidatus Hamiltonella defensa]
MVNHTINQRVSNLRTLRPRKHELEFFIADEVELSSFRDEMASMEHPFFAMKGGDTKTRKYKNGNITVTVEPTSSGMATIFDKDVWIYSISKLQEAMNNNEEISRTICFTPYDFLVTTNREIGGRTYNELEKSLKRLSGTRITTNIVYSDEKQESIGFGLIDSWRILDEKKGKLDIGMIEVTLPDWLYQALHKKKMLKISPDYFRIRKATDRRIYEIARKHCGHQGEFNISVEKLHLKTGSTALLKMFRHNIKQLVKSNDLPDYEMRYDVERDSVVFYNKNLTSEKKETEKQREKGKRELYKFKNLLDEKLAAKRGKK